MNDWDFVNEPNHDDKPNDADDYHRRNPHAPRTRKPQPTGARAVGIYWIVIAVLLVLFIIVFQIILPIRAIVKQPPNAPIQPAPAPPACACFLELLLAAFMMTSGIRQVLGYARDTLVASLVSCAVAMIYILLGVLFAVVSTIPNPFGDVFLIALIVCASVALVFASAGFFGFLVRGAYVEWYRRENPPPIEDEDDWDDDYDDDDYDAPRRYR